MGTSEIEARLIKCIDRAMNSADDIVRAFRRCLTEVPKDPCEWYALGLTLSDCSLALRQLVRETRSCRNSICADMNERNRKEAADGKDAD